MALRFGLSLVFILGMVSVDASVDYCQYKCNNGQTNIGCNNNLAMESNCPKGASLHEPNQTEINQILNLHNKYRNEVAAGQTPGETGKLQAACRMPRLTWSPDLAKIACFNAKTCQFAHDSCRSTDQFQYAGQNLYIQGYSASYPEMSNVLSSGSFSWYNESRLTTMNDINKYPANPSADIGHFTAMATDRTTQVGCCTSSWNDGKFYWTYLVCNYASTNIINYSVYKTSPNCVKCQQYDTNPATPKLCLDNVDPNNIQ